MLVVDLLSVIERLAPAQLAQHWDNSGLQAGDPAARVYKILASLELTEDVLAEAVDGGFDTVITHHPVLFSPMRTLVENKPKESLLRGLVRGGISVISCHTNLDAAEGGMADIFAQALGIGGRIPLAPAAAGWVKFVGFVPTEKVDAVAEAVFAAGAGGIGKYAQCAFAGDGQGWFTPGEGASPTVGKAGKPERTEEVRWETVVPKHRLAEVVRSFVTAHPYEEPAFDVYPVEDVLPFVGLGRVGDLPQRTTVERLAQTVAESCGVSPRAWSRPAERPVRRVAVVPGSGHGIISVAMGLCDVLISGDFGYHDSDLAAENGLALIDVPHGEIEWWAFRRWCDALADNLGATGVEIRHSERWCTPWLSLAGNEARGRSSG